jgi:hypothetical protein
MYPHLLTILSGAVLLSPEATAPPQDSCRRVLPRGLQEAVHRQYPAYRLPSESDNLPDDIRVNREQGGSGCLGVAVARYRGGKSNDYAFLLTSPAPAENVLLVVGSQEGSQWRLELLRDWGAGGRGVLYVESARPGKYGRTQALEGPVVEPGELSYFASKLPGVESGRVESSGVAYFFTAKGWVHVWVSD